MWWRQTSMKSTCFPLFPRINSNIRLFISLSFSLALLSKCNLMSCLISSPKIYILKIKLYTHHYTHTHTSYLWTAMSTKMMNINAQSASKISEYVNKKRRRTHLSEVIKLTDDHIIVKMNIISPFVLFIKVH